jgi:putative ABC transport system permease protein
MTLYFLRQTLREMYNSKGFFFINTLGLTLGVVVFMVIAFWIHTELSYDKFHEKAESIHRVDYLLYEEGVLEQYSAAAVPVIGPMLVQTYPEVEMYTRFHKTEGVVRYKDVFFKETDMFFAQSSFFSLFSFPLAEGHVEENTLGVNKAVITQRAAHRYFGLENPIGKIIEVNGADKYEIAAIAQDPPITSHLHFDILLSYENLINRGRRHDVGWFFGEYYTYVQLAPGVNFRHLEQKIPKLVETHLGDFMKQADFLAEFKFTPLKDIHLHSRLDNELKANGSMLRVQALGLIALVILMVAFTNYIILNTSRSADRSYKVALHKAMGAKKNQLIGWLLSETTIIMFVVLLLGLIIIYFFTPVFENILGSYVRFSGYLLIVLIAFILGVSTLFTGLLPAISVLQVPASSVRQGKKLLHSKAGNFIRNSLILFQFTASIALIAGTIVLSMQMNHLLNHNPGFNADRILVVEAPKAIGNMDEYSMKFEAFRNEMIRNPYVKQVSASSSVPGEDVRFRPVYGRAPLPDEPQLHSSNMGKIIHMVIVDQWYLETYELNLLAGRNFSSNTNLNPHEVILNHSALAYMGFNSAEEAVGARLTSDRGNAVVVGVINDYNQRSLHHATSPMVLANRPTNYYFSVNFEGNQMQSLISTVESRWNDFFPGNPLSYKFLNTSFFKEHIADRQFGRLLTIFTLMAIFISCLGLMGLSSYNTTMRTKEIGIRKANGARVFDVLLLLNIDLIKWVVIAFVLATPLAWLGMNRWLQNFAYRTELSWWIFAAAGVISLIISLTTVSWQSWRAARRNPVEALRYE